MINCGIDEAGRGPVIGPMVMAILCGDDEKIKNIGAKDSKKLSPSRREDLFNELIKYNYKYFIIEPEEIDEYVKNKKLNVMEENYAIKLIGYTENSYDIYVDSFDVNEKRLEETLKKYTLKKIICKHHADDIYPAVSGASIIAKVIRDNEIKKLHDVYGDFGSGYPSDERTVKFLEYSIKNNINIEKIVRKQWKTYKNIMYRKLF